MTDIDVPDWVVAVADEAAAEFVESRTMSMYASLDDMRRDCASHMLRAALSAWVVPAPALHISERCAACGDVLHASVSSDNHFTLRQEKPE